VEGIDRAFEMLQSAETEQALQYFFPTRSDSEAQVPAPAMPGADGETLSEASPAMEALSAEKIALPMEAPPMPDADAGPALVPTPALEPPATPAAEVLPPLTPASPAPASEKALPDPVFILPNTPLVLPAPVAGPNLERMPQEPE